MAEDDPLSWLLELDAKLDGAKEMLESLKLNEDGLKALDKSLKATEDASRRAGEGHKKHAHEVKTTAEEVKHLRERLNDLTLFQVGEWGFDKALELGKELVEVVAEIGKEAFKTAAHQERIAKSFKLQLGDEQGGEVLEYLEKLGKQTEFVGAETKAYGQDLIKAGFAAKDLPYALAAIADLAGMTADRTQGAASAMEALAKIQRSGKVMERSLQPFGIGEDKLIDVLQRRGNKSGAESIKKALQAGTLDREELLQSVYQAITEKTGKKLGGVGEELAKGLEARLHRLGSLPELYFEKWADSPGFQIFSDRIDAIFKKLDPDSPDGRQIFAALEGALNSVTSVLDKLLTPEGLNTFVSGLTKALDTVGALIRGLQDLIDLLNGETLSRYFYGGKNADDKVTQTSLALIEGKLAAGNAEGERSVQGQFYGMDEAQRADVLAAAKAKGLDLSRFEPKKLNTSNIGRSSEYTAGDLTLEDPGAKSAAADAGKEVAAAHLDGVRDGLDMHSPSRRLLKLGRLAADSFAMGVEDSAPNVSDAFDFAPPNLGAGGAGGGGLGGSRSASISIPLYVTVEGAMGDNAEALAKRVVELAPTALQAAIEQLRAELGA